MSFNEGFGFYFKNEHSSKYKIMEGMVDGDGLKTHTWLIPEKEIIEETIPRNPIPFYQGINYKPQSFEVSICVNDEIQGEEVFTEQDVFKLRQWLSSGNNYYPLVFDWLPDKIWMAQIVGGLEWTTINRFQGWGKINFRCNSPFCYSKLYQNFHTDAHLGIPLIENRGTQDIYPIIEITAKTTSLVLYNGTTGQTLTFSNLIVGETIVLDTRSYKCVQKGTNLNRFTTIVGSNAEFRFIQGFNQLVVKSGQCDLLFKYRFMY